MSKKNVVNSAGPSPAVSKAISALEKAQVKRELRYANRFVVYGYKLKDGFFTPNMLVLPKSSEAANPSFVVENIRSSVTAGKFKIPDGLRLIRLGEFNLQSGKFDSLSHKVVFDFDNQFVKEVK